MLSYFDLPIDFLKRRVKIVLFDESKINKSDKLYLKDVKDCLHFLDLHKRFTNLDEFLLKLFPDESGITLKDATSYFKGFFAYRYHNICDTEVDDDEFNNTSLIFICVKYTDIYDTVNTISHEVTHCIGDICKPLGIKDDETISYLTGYFIEEILKRGLILDKYTNLKNSIIKKLINKKEKV